jgi:5'-3' exoribonuclease 1
MGIPSYFSYIIKNYPKIISNLSCSSPIKTQEKFHHLYMDCNSIIYDSISTIKKNTNIKEFEQELIHQVIHTIEKYIQKINPSNTIFIAFDGVAPFAKMKQQKTRRYKSAFIYQLNYIKKNEPTHSIEESSMNWSSSNITPGTQFMNTLSSQIGQYFNTMENKYRVKKIIVSGSNEVGEGEHKIFQYIRKQPCIDDNVIIYGLDSDLIMLSIFHSHLFKNGYIFREAPEFLKSSIELENYEENKNEPYLIDISMLCNYILCEMNCQFSEKRRVYDYVFLCFFLGNDFLPHFPALNIRTHGIPVLLDMYSELLGKYHDRYFISTKNTIQWKYVKMYIYELSKREHSFLMTEYSVRNKYEKREWKNTTEKDRDMLFNHLPVIYRTEEKYICPSENMWEERYYTSLFHGIQKTPENIQSICTNYLEGLEWVYTYYSGECKDWKWTYKYHYPPLLMDLQSHIPNNEMEFLPKPKNTRKNASNNEFLPYVQLAYVLPKEQLYLLPKSQEMYLMEKYMQFYTDVDKIKFSWAFCRYFWEAHVDFVDIPMEILDTWMNELYKK